MTRSVCFLFVVLFALMFVRPARAADYYEYRCTSPGVGSWVSVIRSYSTECDEVAGRLAQWLSGTLGAGYPDRTSAVVYYVTATGNAGLCDPEASVGVTVANADTGNVTNSSTHLCSIVQRRAASLTELPTADGITLAIACAGVLTLAWTFRKIGDAIKETGEG